MEPQIKRPRIRAIPPRGSRLLTVSAIFLILAGASMLLFRLVFSDTAGVTTLFPLSAAFLLIASGVLLFFCRDRTALFIVFCLLLIGVMIIDTGYIPAAAALLMLLSAIGWRFNIVPAKFPPLLRRPVFNLLAAVVSIVSILDRADSSRLSFVRNLEVKPAASLILVLFTVLPLVALLLINLAVQPREIEKRVRPEFRIRAALPERGGLFKVAAWMLVVAGAGVFIVNFVNYISHTIALRIPIFDALLVWAGFLLVRNRGQNGRLTAAVILITLNTVFFYIYTPSTQLNIVLPVIMMLVSVIGVTWNATPGFLKKKLRTPLLNLIAAVLFFVYLIITAYDHIASSTVTATAASLSTTPWYNIILTILLPLSLMLLNLSLSSGEVARKNADSKYRRGFAGLVQRIYSNVGNGLQTLARVVGIFFLCIAVLSVVTLALGIVDLVLNYVGGIFLLAPVALFIAGGTGLVGSIIMIFCTWPLFAYGQITSDVRELKEDGGVSPVYAEENPDDLPEL